MTKNIEENFKNLSTYNKIIFINDIFIEDIAEINKLAEKRINNFCENFLPTSAIYNTTLNKNYILLPTHFYSLNKWIKYTNLHCWYCDCTFNSIPVFIPKSIDFANKKNEYCIRTYGCFCSFNCAKKYININYKKLEINLNKTNMLNYLFEIFNKKKVIEILESPNKYLMKKYGGDLTIIEYKNKIQSLCNIFP